MNFSIEHIAVPAANPVALKNWYVRVLGARPIWDNGQNPPVCLIALSGALAGNLRRGNPAGRTWQQQAGRFPARGIARGFD
jgi:catechol 2,3-dioxygenase-like lactoylglutathione lyase family enzyme